MSNYQQFDRVYLCTLAQFKTQRYGGGTVETYSADDDATIDFYIQQASRMIVDEVLHQLPLPYVDTLKFDAPHTYEDGRVMGFDFINAYVLYTGDDAPLLEVTTLTNGDGTTIASSDYVLYPANNAVKSKIRIKSSAIETFDYTTTWEQSITVAGTWGYVPHYDRAWFDSDKNIPAGGLSASATSFTFSTASDASAYSTGDYIRVDAEVMLVTDSNTSTGVVTIERGVLGTTATTHDAATDIEQFRQHQQIMAETALFASSMYNAKRGFFDGSTPLPTEAIEGIRQRLAAHVRYNA